MIALFCDDLAFATHWADVVIFSMSRFVDGPYRGFEGKLLGKSPARLYLVEQEANSAYIASRLAVRRGATHLIPLLRTTSLEKNATLSILEPVSSIWDLLSLDPFLRITPDCAKQFNLSIDDHLPAQPIWKTNQPGLSLGTPPFAIGNPFVGQELSKKLGVSLLDLQGSGYAQGACEEEVAFSPLAIITSHLTERGLQDASMGNWEERFFDAFVPQIEKLSQIGFEPVGKQPED
jgi:hypothetical protein